MSKKEGMSEDTHKLVGKAMRGDKRIKSEDLVANELAQAVLSESMNKIRHTCEALMLLDENEIESAGITEEEEKRMEEIYILVQTFENTHIDRVAFSTSNFKDNYATLQWPFGEEEMKYYYYEYLEPARITWYSDVLDEMEKKRKKLEKKDLEEYQIKYRMSKGHYLSMSAWKRLRGNFIVSAMPTVGKILKKIIQVVSTSSFQAAMKRIKGAGS